MGIFAEDKKAHGQIYNLGSEEGNYSKDEIVNLILKRLPETKVQYKDLTFGGDMRDITASFEKVRKELKFSAQFSVDEGVRELLNALQTGLIREPQNERFRNAQFIVQ